MLFAREFAIPGALIQDIHSGTPVPVAVGRALQTFAQIELEAGRELVGFAAEYVGFQLNFLVNLVTTPVAAVGEFATSLLAGLTPVAAATGARRTQRIGGRAPDKAVNVARADRSDNSRRSHDDEHLVERQTPSTRTTEEVQINCRGI